MAKQAEDRVVALANYYGWFERKFRDVSYCPFCKTPLPKSEQKPDYYIGQVGSWVEAKNNDSSGSWRCSEIMEGGERKLQREFFEENGGWLFIELADGRAPKKAAAYLIPWSHWVSKIEPILIKNKMKSFKRETTLKKDGSVRRLGADRLLLGYELQWETYIGWIIPPEHIYWKAYKAKLEKELLFVNKEISKCQTKQLPLV